jgi:type VI secretion system secreted protein VgrG
MNLREEIEELLKKYPDPRRKSDGILEFAQRMYNASCPPVMGIVADNKDPDCLGRLRIAMDMLSPGCVGSWYPMMKQWAGKNSGMWILPDIGTQVLVFFPEGDYDHGVVAGCVYDEKHMPPAHSTDNPSKSILYQTKDTRIEIIDEDGKEAMQLSMAEGKMRFVLSKKDGISLVNELGDIHVKCKELEISGEDNISFKAKKMSIESDGEINCKANKTVKIECDKKVEVKGKNIKMQGSKGVTTGGKQLAVEGDKVMGFDVHTMVVPAGNHTENVPLPHPFIGKLNDKLAKDVSIGSHKAAVKGSKAKNDSPTHNQLPGTIKFQKNPKNEGEVTGGTADKLKIDGKEACVIGSQVTTCNDVGAQNNSTVIAVGASMPMPVIINPKNTEKWKEDKAKENNKKPQFTTVKWGKTSAKEGEEVELSANVKDIDDGNMVTLQVFPEGKDPAADVPFAKLPLTVKGGSVTGKWSYSRPSGTPPAGESLKFFFSAHSAWCQMKKSGTLEITYKKPSFSGLKWEKDGKTASEFDCRAEAVMSTGVTNLEDGAYVNFLVYEEGYDNKRRYIKKIAGQVSGGTATASYTMFVSSERLASLGEGDELKYVFAVETTDGWVRSGDSPAAQVVFGYEIEFSAAVDQVGSESSYTLTSTDGAYSKTLTVKNDAVEKDTRHLLRFEKIVPGKRYTLKYVRSGEGNGQYIFESADFSEIVTI